MQGEFHCELHSMEQGWSSGIYDPENTSIEELLEKAKEIKDRCSHCIGSGCLVYEFIQEHSKQEDKV